MKSKRWQDRLRAVYHLTMRERGTPEYIARGWAAGVFVGCVVPVFCQLAVAVPLSFAVRGSKIGAVIGTFVTTPPTAIVIYPIQIWIGDRLIGGELSFSGIRQAASAMLTKGDFHAFLDMGREMILAFFAGGFAWALVMTPAVYFLVQYLVRRYRSFRNRRRMKRQGFPGSPVR